MDRKKLVLLLGALIIAIGTAFGARSMLAGGSATPSAEAASVPTGPKVLVAKRALPAGTIITLDALTYQPWPQELIQDAYYTEENSNVEKLLGTVVRFPVTAGEPVTQGQLVSPGDRGFLAAALGAGMRAVTVPVSATTGVAGFVFAGDRVDLLLTQTVEGEGRALKAAETVMRNLRVLATDQTTESTTDENGKTQVAEFRTVTLEVTPKIAEKIAVAQTIGTLSLALRSIADNSAELDRAIASGEVKIPAGATPEQEEKLLKAALAMPLDKGTTFSTGGDVSRFQRKSVPPQEGDRQPAPPPQQYTPPAPGVPAKIDSVPVYRGPSVRVTRGKETTEVPVDSGVRGAVNTQASGIRRAGQVAPATSTSTLF